MAKDMFITAKGAVEKDRTNEYLNVLLSVELSLAQRVVTLNEIHQHIRWLAISLSVCSTGQSSGH